MAHKCVHCPSTYLHKANLIAHQDNVHPLKLNTTQYPYRCYFCKAKFLDTSTSMKHYYMMHAPKEGQKYEYSAVSSSEKAVKKALKEQLNMPNPLWTSINSSSSVITKEDFIASTSLPKEKPMTLIFTDISKAKKQRDKLREQARLDISKYCAKFGVTQFEAAHAIFDTVLSNINTSAPNFGGHAMPNGLAQTLLQETTNLMAGSPTPVIHQVMKAKTPEFAIWDDLPGPSSLKQTVYSSAVKLTKPDSAVTEADLERTKMVWTGKEFSVMKGALTNLENTNPDKLFAWGKVFKPYYWIANSQFVKGWNYVIFSLKKTAPYIDVANILAYKLIVPDGYKWRKLKNKPIYKLVPDPKQVDYWNKQTEKSQDASSGSTQGTKYIMAKDKYNHVVNIKVGFWYSNTTANILTLPPNYWWVSNPTEMMKKAVKKSPQVPKEVVEALDWIPNEVPYDTEY